MNLKKSQPAHDESESPTGSSSLKLLLVGGGLVGLAAAGGLAFVLLSGGDDPSAVAAVPLPVPTASAPTDAATPSTSASIPTYAAKNARDPFKALVSDSTGGGAASGSGSSSTAPTTAPSGPSTSPSSWTPPATTVTVTSKPSTSTTTRTSSPSSTSPTTSEPTVPYDVNVVVLDKIVDATTVQMYAGDTPLVLHVGDAPVGPFALKSVDTVNQTATVQYGEVTVTLQLHQVVFLQQS